MERKQMHMEKRMEKMIGLLKLEQGSSQARPNLDLVSAHCVLFYMRVTLNILRGIRNTGTGIQMGILQLIT